MKWYCRKGFHPWKRRYLVDGRKTTVYRCRSCHVAGVVW